MLWITYQRSKLIFDCGQSTNLHLFPAGIQERWPWAKSPEEWIKGFSNNVSISTDEHVSDAHPQTQKQSEGHQLSPHPTIWWERRTGQTRMHMHPRGHTHTRYYLSWNAFWGTCLSSSSSSSVLLSTGSCLCFQIIPLRLSIDSRSPLPRSWFLYLCIPLPLFPHTFPPRTLTARLSPSHGLGLASELTGNSESSHDNPNPGRVCVRARTSMCVCFVFEMGLRGICVCVCVCVFSVCMMQLLLLRQPCSQTHTQGQTKINTHRCRC